MEGRLTSFLAASSWADQDYVKSLARYIYLSNSVSYTAFLFNVKRCLKKLNISYSQINPEDKPSLSQQVICRLSYLLGKSLGRSAELSFLQELQLLNQESTWIWEAILVTNLRIDNQYVPDQEILSVFKAANDQQWAQSRVDKLKAYREQFAKMEDLLDSARLEGMNLNRAQNKGEKLKLAYSLHNSLPESSGGYATRAQGVAHGLSKHSIDITCVTRPGAPWDIPGFKAVDEPKLGCTFNNVKYEKIKEPSRKSYTGFNYIEKASKSMKVKIKQLNSECVMAASNYINAFQALLASKALKLPFFYEVRGFWEVTRVSREPEYFYTIDMFAQEFFESFTAKNSDHVFTLTLPMKEELIDRGVSGSNITLVPNSCDIEEFISTTARDENLAVKYSIPKDSVVIGYIGSFVQYEGLENLVEACVLLKEKSLNFRLLLVGNENVSAPGSKGPITDEIERLVTENNLHDHIIMPGRIPHEDVPAHYSLIDIAPFPRKPQPVTEMVSPMKPLESFAMKKTVVVSSVKALKDMVLDRKTGLIFEKGNIDSLADKLEELILDQDLRHKLGQQGYNWVLENRLWENTAKTMANKILNTVSELSP